MQRARRPQRTLSPMLAQAYRTLIQSSFTFDRCVDSCGLRYSRVWVDGRPFHWSSRLHLWSRAELGRLWTRGISDPPRAFSTALALLEYFRGGRACVLYQRRRRLGQRQIIRTASRERRLQWPSRSNTTRLDNGPVSRAACNQHKS
jgi:hypothetical protein